MVTETASGAEPAPLAGSSNGFRKRFGRAAPFLPGLAVLIFLFIVPLLIMFVFSFWRTVNFKLTPDLTLDNYIRFFAAPTYLRTFAKTLIMASLVTIFTLAIALPFAYYLVRYTSRRVQRGILLAVIVPFWTSYLLRVYAWQAILGENGALNQLLMGLHLIDQPSTLFVYDDPARLPRPVLRLLPVRGPGALRLAGEVRLHPAQRRPGPRGPAGPGVPPHPAAADPGGHHHRLRSSCSSRSSASS